MSKTKRHHFIPVFYLKQFTNEHNQFYIYDVKKQEFRGNGRLFYPSQQFYEHYGNTTYYVEESDYIEQEFSKIDSQVGAILQKLKTSGSSTFEEMDWLLLQYFVNILYWRIPANTGKVKAYIQNATSLGDFKMALTDNFTCQRVSKEEELKLLERIKKDGDFYKYIKLRLPAITYPEIFKKPINDFASVITFPFADRLPKLVSDNPIIYRRPGDESLHTDEFIFPVSPTFVLFRHRIPEITALSYIRVLMDMLLLLQANEYISCTSKEYPQMLYTAFNNGFSSVDQLREKVFSFIYDKLKMHST